MKTDTTILYLADPMCSWCWGFAPSLKAIQAIAPQVPVQIVLGGLAPDSEEPMEASLRCYIQQAWRDVAAQCDVEFNFDFWERCSPRRSTYPACRAVVVARTFNLEMSMFQSIQHAYYLEARNPSDLNVLVEIAVTLGIPKQEFLDHMMLEQTQQALEADFQLRNQLHGHSFPSIGVRRQGATHLLHSGYCSPDEATQIWRLWDGHI